MRSGQWVVAATEQSLPPVLWLAGQCSQLESENQSLCQKIDVLEQGLTESKAMIDTLKNGLVQALEEL